MELIDILCRDIMILRKKQRQISTQNNIKSEHKKLPKKLQELMTKYNSQISSTISQILNLIRGASLSFAVNQRHFEVKHSHKQRSNGSESLFNDHGAISKEGGSHKTKDRSAQYLQKLEEMNQLNREFQASQQFYAQRIEKIKYDTC